MSKKVKAKKVRAKTVRAKTVEAKTDRQKDYFKLVFGTDEPERDKVEAALEKAHEIRQFEIRLYWQRSLFFWGFILTFFGAYMLLLSQEKLSNYIILALPILALIGLFSSFAWYHIELGSASWQKNWELHIDFLEDHVTGRLHKTILGKENHFFSLSTILRHFIIVIAFVWFVLLGYAGYNLLEKLCVERPDWLINIINWKKSFSDDWFSTSMVFYLLIGLVLLIWRQCFWRTSEKATIPKPSDEVAALALQLASYPIGGPTGQVF